MSNWYQAEVRGLNYNYIISLWPHVLDTSARSSEEDRAKYTSCTCLGSSVDLPGQRWWLFCDRGSLHFGQYVKVAEGLLEHQ